jgi:hypothetical protein
MRKSPSQVWCSDQFYPTQVRCGGTRCARVTCYPEKGAAKAQTGLVSGNAVPIRMRNPRYLSGHLANAVPFSWQSAEPHCPRGLDEPFPSALVRLGRRLRCAAHRRTRRNARAHCNGRWRCARRCERFPFLEPTRANEALPPKPSPLTSTPLFRRRVLWAARLAGNDAPLIGERVATRGAQRNGRWRRARRYEARVIQFEFQPREPYRPHPATVSFVPAPDSRNRIQWRER